MGQRARHRERVPHPLRRQLPARRREPDLLVVPKPGRRASLLPSPSFPFPLSSSSGSRIVVSSWHDFLTLSLFPQVSNQLAWLTIGITSTRFRWAWAAQGRSVSELRFPNPAGRWAGPIVTVSTAFIILVQGWSVFKPFDAVSFVANYIELPIFVALYLVFRLAKWGKVRTPSLKEIDLDTGRYVNTAEDDKDDEDRAARESGRLGWAWKAWGWIA